MSEWICPDKGGYYCLDCLKGSIVKKGASVEWAKCRWCGRDQKGVAFEEIDVFIPYMPLVDPPEDWYKSVTK